MILRIVKQVIAKLYLHCQWKNPEIARLSHNTARLNSTFQGLRADGCSTCNIDFSLVRVSHDAC